MKLIDLLNKMYHQQIKTGTQFTLRYKEFTLNTYEIRECDFGLMIWDLDNDSRFDSEEYILDYLNYTVEIIEENKEIEELKIEGENGTKDKVFHYIDGSNLYSLSLFCAFDLPEKINELVRAVNRMRDDEN